MILLGDCLERLKELADNSVDSVVTDPPAGISFMSKKWDDDKGGRDQWVKWLSEIMREVSRTLKPGGHMLVWAIPRTSHWTATAIENAGFEIRDVITHHFGSGFPKSLDVSKAIDKAAGVRREVIGSYKATGTARNSQHIGAKTHAAMGEYEADVDRIYQTAPATALAKQWSGWGTSLKPASEHWILARKPLAEKTVANNVLKHGTGVLNIDQSRIGSEPRTYSLNGAIKGGNFGNKASQPASEREHVTAQGRWPSNLILGCDCESDTHEPECPVAILDGQSGILKQGVAGKKSRPYGDGNIFGTASEFKPNGTETYECEKPSGASRFFYVAKASKRERNLGLEGMPEKLAGAISGKETRPDRPPNHTMRANFHPTVKPQRLMQYLIKLITPPNGTVLDPFMGSGSTAVAAFKNGFKFIGIERDEEYFKIAEKRIEHTLKNGS